MAVANITEYSNAVTIAAAISALQAPAFVKSTCMLGLIHAEDLPSGTNAKKFVKRGSLTAASLAESTAMTVDANGELTDTSVTATAAKVAVSSGLSVEADTFTSLDTARIAGEQGAAIGRFVDNDALSLFGGFSTTVTSTSVLTIDDVMLGQFNIYNSECPNKEVTLQCVVHPKAYYNIKKELIQSGASAFTSPDMLAVLKGKPAQNCYVGSIPGLADFYSTTGQQTSGGDTQDAIFHPRWALAGIFASAPVTWITKKGSEGAYTEVFSYYLYDVTEWNDLAGVLLNSDT